MDFGAIGKAASKSDSLNRPVVAGRVLQFDADFGCYNCAHLEDSVQSNFKNLKAHIESKRILAGAEKTNCHISLGLKGGRTEIATVKPYQAQRHGVNLEVKARVAELRCLLANYSTDKVTPIANLYTEADDSLTAYQMADLENSVLMSGDKDLWMAMGWHCDASTGRMYKVTGYGKTEYREVGNVKPKLVGEGTSWFWHQILMGDTADNIAGLPKLSGKLMNKYVPTKKFNPKRKAGQCGEAKAVAILKDVKSDGEAHARVMDAYFQFYGSNYKEMIVEQAFLLWMRRTPAVDDCLKFLNETGKGYVFSPRQKAALKKFKQLCLVQHSIGDK